MDVVTSESGAEIRRCLLLSGGEWVPGAGEVTAVLDKYSLEQVAEAPAASEAQITGMIAAAHDAFRADTLTPYERGEILDRAVQIVGREKESLAGIIQAESGFTHADALGEVTRCMQTLRLSAEEARRLKGDIIPMSGAPNQGRRMAFSLRVPLGVVLAVTPFNSPLNTVTHKVGPALAAGNAVVLKPASATPMTSCKLAEILVEAGVPKGLLSVLHGGGAVVQAAIADEKIRFIAFTGSTITCRRAESVTVYHSGFAGQVYNRAPYITAATGGCCTGVIQHFPVAVVTANFCTTHHASGIVIGVGNCFVSCTACCEWGVSA